MAPLGVDSQALVLAAFREEHPEWNIFPGEFSNVRADQ
jgi:hypothetical protein